MEVRSTEDGAVARVLDHVGRHQPSLPHDRQLLPQQHPERLGVDGRQSRLTAHGRVEECGRDGVDVRLLGAAQEQLVGAKLVRKLERRELGGRVVRPAH